MAEEESSKDESIDKKAVKLVLFPAINKLVEPIATTLGEELNNRVKAYFSKARKEKKSTNLIENLQIVNDDLQQDEIIPNPEVAQLEFFDQWVDGIADVDPDDVIAKAWRGLLSDAVRKKGDEEILLDRLSQLKGYDANYLVQNFIDTDEIKLLTDRDKFFCQRLSNIGITDLTTISSPATKLMMSLSVSSITIETNGAKLNWIGEKLISYLRTQPSA